MTGSFVPGSAVPAVGQVSVQGTLQPQISAPRAAKAANLTGAQP